MTDTHNDFYQTLRIRIRKWLEKKGPGFKYADVLLVAPDLFHLLTRLVLDKRIPPVQKAKLAAAIAYFVSPVDIVPEALVGPAGYVDDVAVAALALHALVNAGHGEVAKELWAGDGDLLELIQTIFSVADEMIGSGLWNKVQGWWKGV